MCKAMGDFWGMIRSLKMISLAGAIQVNIPLYLHLFLTILVKLASADILDGGDFYGEHLSFIELPSPSE